MSKDEARSGSLISPQGLWPRFRGWLRDSPFLSWGLAIFLAGFVAFWSTRLHRDSLYFLVFFPLLAALRWRDWKFIFSSGTIKLVSLFLAYMLLTGLWGGYGDDGLYNSFRYSLIILGAVVAIAWVVSKSDLWPVRWLIALVFAAITALIYSSVVFYAEHPFPASRLVNLLYYHDNPNPAAVGFLLVFVFSLFSVLTGGSRLKWIAIVGLLAALVFLVLAQSRGLLLAAVVSAFVQLVYFRYWKVLLVAGFAALFGLLALEWTDWGMRGFLERGDARRFEVWQAALSRIAESKIFGEGLGTDTRIEISGGRTVYSPHNLPLMSFLVGGTIGGALLAGLLFVLVRTVTQDFLRGGEVAALAGSAMVAGLVLVNVDSHNIITRIHPQIWVGFWIPVGLVAGRELVLKSRHVISK